MNHYKLYVNPTATASYIRVPVDTNKLIKIKM